MSPSHTITVIVVRVLRVSKNLQLFRKVCSFVRFSLCQVDLLSAHIGYNKLCISTDEAPSGMRGATGAEMGQSVFNVVSLPGQLGIRSPAA